MKDNMEKNNKLQFAAINPYIVSNIINDTESEIRSQDFIEFGTRNEYPNYIYDLYDECATLHSIILGTKDYIMGSKIVNNTNIMSDNELENFVEDIAFDIMLYGGSYIEVLRNAFGKIAKLNVLNFRNVRSNKDNTKFYYSVDFSNKKSYGRCKCKTYECYDPNNKKQLQSIYLIKNDRRRTYPTPSWCAAVKAAEIERSINDYHLNNLANGFATFHVINFNNGVPEDEIKREIEKDFNEKFCGTQNAGRIMLSWNNDKDHNVTIDSLDIKDYGDQYDSLQKRSKSELFVAFRATPILFGLPLDNDGFNNQEYNAAFKLYNKTVVKPIQNTIIRTLENILGENNVMTIEPFKINFDETSAE